MQDILYNHSMNQIPVLRQDFDGGKSSVSEITDILRQTSSPTEYKRQFDILLATPEKLSGFEQVRLDSCERVFVFGDVHARPEALAKGLEKIEESCKKRGSDLDTEFKHGRLAIFFVGDLVHGEKNINNYQSGDTTDKRKKIAEENLNTVLGIAKLKSKYPTTVFVTRGNHDVSATVSGVAKMGIDQGLKLGEVLAQHQLEVPLQATLNQFPSLVGLHIGDKHILLSHALPIPFGDYAGVARYLDSQKLPFQGDQSMTNFIKGIWGETPAIASGRIRNHDQELERLLTWGKVQSPRAGVETVLALGEQTRLPGDVLSEKSIRFVQDYLYLLMKFLFSSTKAGLTVKPSDILWFVGHEQTYTGMRNIATVLDSRRLTEKDVKIIQINDSSSLPIFGINTRNWGKEDFLSDKNLIKVK